MPLQGSTEMKFPVPCEILHGRRRWGEEDGGLRSGGKGLALPSLGHPAAPLTPARPLGVDRGHGGHGWRKEAVS